VGIAPFLKRRHPGLVLYASARAVEVLKKPKVIRAINDANQYVIESRGLASLCTHLDLAWRTGIECVPVREGDQIDLGDQKLKIYATPGHSPCSISAYVPGMKVLFPSESAGIPFRDKISTYGISDLSAFEQSLQKLKNLQVSCLCSDHYGYVFGDEADGFIAASIKVAKSRRKLMESALRLSGSVDEAARQIAKLFQDEGEFNLVPEDVFFESHRQMIMHIAGHLR
jgi:glyoxylase-like metal-dependent hydrolase (beta-lactamase superfamily II)